MGAFLFDVSLASLVAHLLKADADEHHFLGHLHRDSYLKVDS